MEEVTYTIKQVAQLLRVDANTVRQWVRHGILEAEQIKEGVNHGCQVGTATV